MPEVELNEVDLVGQLQEWEQFERDPCWRRIFIALHESSGADIEALLRHADPRDMVAVGMLQARIGVSEWVMECPERAKHELLEQIEGGKEE